MKPSTAGARCLAHRRARSSSGSASTTGIAAALVQRPARYRAPAYQQRRAAKAGVACAHAASLWHVLALAVRPVSDRLARRCRRCTMSLPSRSPAFWEPASPVMSAHGYSRALVRIGKRSPRPGSRRHSRRNSTGVIWALHAAAVPLTWPAALCALHHTCAHCRDAWARLPLALALGTASQHPQHDVDPVEQRTAQRSPGSARARLAGTYSRGERRRIAHSGHGLLAARALASRET